MADQEAKLKEVGARVDEAVDGVAGGMGVTPKENKPPKVQAQA